MDFTTLFSLHTLQSLLDLLGYPAVTLLILLESAGLPLPGESMVLLASFYAATSHQLQLPLIMLCAALGAIMGDNIGYLIGRTGGRRFVERFGKYFFLKTSHLEYAERFFARHGAKTVFFGRFITLLRIWAAFLAGMNQMPWRTFMFYNALGGITWAILIGSLGYFGGIFFQDHFDQVEQLVKLIGWGGLGAFILLAIGMLLFLRLRHARQQRQPANKESSSPSHAL